MKKAKGTGGRGRASKSRSTRRLTLVAGGDTEWQSAVDAPEILLDFGDTYDGGWPPLPLVNGTRAVASLALDPLRRPLPEESHASDSVNHSLSFPNERAMVRYPLRKLAPIFRAADLGFLNLEMPLSREAGRRGAFRGSPLFAEALRWAGVHVVSLANNHMLDAGEVGLTDTQLALQASNIGTVGGGDDLGQARRPFVTTRNGIAVGLLAYNQIIGAGGTGIFATRGRSGVAPLDPSIIQEDIRKLRKRVDVVCVSCHWGEENTFEVHPAARRLGHQILDAGADVILGHHSHLAQGVEVRGGKVIFYSLGNLAFGHSHDYWDDNTLARIELGARGVNAVELLPIAGRRNEVTQPHLLPGKRATAALERLQARSRELDTEVTIEDGIGHLRLR
ncbi:MAG: CapA family protein [Myxococcales bacterium]|nr:CapA family protein [Myxococcales bacterium]